jgi:hypothetical protein
MKLDPGMHIGLHWVFFGKSGVTGVSFPNPGYSLSLLHLSPTRHPALTRYPRKEAGGWGALARSLSNPVEAAEHRCGAHPARRRPLGEKSGGPKAEQGRLWMVAAARPDRGPRHI